MTPDARWVRPALVAPIAALLYVLVLIALRGDSFVLVTLGSRFAPAELQGHIYSSSGYDGQFTYYLARYGLDAAALLDSPPYRAQRMLLPLLGWVLSFGQTGILVWGLLAVNVVALTAGTYWMELLLVRRGASVWPALGFAMSIGMAGAVRMTTNETLAYSLVLGAIVLFDSRRTGWSGFVFGLAALTKEPTLLCAGACVVALLHQRRLRDAVAMACWPALLFALWQLVLFVQLGSWGVGNGGADATGFELVPFRGFLRMLQVPSEFNGIAWTAAGFIGLFVLVPTAWSLVQLVQLAIRGGGWESEDWLLLVNVALVPFVPASTFAEPIGMLRLIVGLQIAVMLFAARHGLSKPLALTHLWAYALLLIVAIDLAAGKAP